VIIAVMAQDANDLSLFHSFTLSPMTKRTRKVLLKEETYNTFPLSTYDSGKVATWYHPESPSQQTKAQTLS